MKKHFSAMLLIFLLIMPFSTQAASFKDVGNNHVLKPEIDYLVKKEIITGYGDGAFRPNELVSKKHVAVMLTRALDLPMDNLKNPGYKDVPVTHLYYKEIAAGYTAGLFSDATYFKPDSHISRGFMAKLLTTGLNLKYIPGKDEEDEFKDVPSTHGFYQYIRTVSSNNVAQGFGDGTYRSAQLITRGHFSAFLARAMSGKTYNLLGDPESVYTYVNEKGEKMRMTFDKANDQKEQLWTLTNAKTGIKTPLIIGQNPSRYHAGIRNSDVGFAVEMPATIRTVYVQKAEGMLPNIAIVDTEASLRIGDKTYSDLIVLREYWTIGMSHDIYLYFAEDIGLVAMKDGKGNMLYQLESIE